MKHFDYILNKEELFELLPENINNNSSKNLIEVGLGALLYMPATKPGWYLDLLKDKHDGLSSMVLDLEDALKESELENGVSNILEGFKELEKANKDLPFIFIRVKNPLDLKRIVESLGEKGSKKLTGVIFPKFDSTTGIDYIRVFKEVNREHNLNLYFMPIIESKLVMNKETRMNELLTILTLLEEVRGSVLNVRVGATDFTSNFGIRRSVNNTVYDMRVVSDCLADILNIFARESSGYVVSGPVWEFFDGNNRILKPQLRESLFTDYGKLGKRKRMELLGEYNDGLIREVLMDKINGFTGKTIIHPSHIKIVNSLYAVTHEEYLDAITILNAERGEGGVLKSNSGNKMNEVKPHYYWAEKIISRAKSFGVLKDGKTFIDLLID